MPPACADRRSCRLGSPISTVTGCSSGWSRAKARRIGMSSSLPTFLSYCANGAAAAKEWLADRRAELLPVPYFHVVFTLPGPIADIAYQNKAVVYDLLLKTAAETLITIAADPKHLGARIGLTAVLHTWGSALTHHPHAHIIVPGGGFSPEPAPAQA